MTKSPTPWRFDHDWHRLPTISAANGRMVAYVEKERREETPEPAANAAFIIKAVNNHDALVEHLRRLAIRACDEPALALLDAVGRQASD